MGLDMYLNKETFIGAEYEHRKVTGAIDVQLDGKPVAIQFNRVSTITERVGYWRKANAIHKWFVENVQGGEDDCEEYEVEVEKMKELLNIVKKVLKDPALAPELLPTASGYFFGSTDYDEWYTADLRDTKKILTTCIKEASAAVPGQWVTFKYRSSW